MKQTQSGPRRVIAVSEKGAVKWSNGTRQQIPHFNDKDYAVLFLVRHCEKVQDGSSDPDLTPEGKQRAERLGKILAEAPFDRLGSTFYQRARKTAEAVRQFAHKPVELDTFAARGHENWFAERRKTPGQRMFFYAGHQNTVPAFLNFLTASSRYETIPETEYGRLYIAVVKGPGAAEVVELNY